MRAALEVTPAAADRAGPEFSARQYRLALAAAGLVLDDAPAPPLLFLHGARLDAPPRVGDGELVLLEPQLAGDAAADLASNALLLRSRLVVTTRGDVHRRLVACLPQARLLRLAPFCDLSRPVAARRDRDALRGVLARRLGVPEATPWLMAPAGGGEAGFASWLLLARALARLVMLDWRLLVAGPLPGGAARAALLALPRERLRLVPEEFLADHDRLLASADLLVWPALEGADHQQLLRAHAVAVAAVACDGPVVRDIVQDALTGRLAPAGNVESFANCVAFLLRQPAFRRAFAAKAFEKVVEGHDLLIAARRLREALAAAGVPLTPPRPMQTP